MFESRRVPTPSVEDLAWIVARSAVIHGRSPWTYRKRLLTTIEYRRRSWRERLFLRVTSILVAQRAVRLVQELRR